MKVGIDCVHCYLKQVVSAMTLAGIHKDEQYKIMYKMMDYVKTLDLNKSPAENSSDVLLRSYKLMDCNDPYEKVKRDSNDLALNLEAYLSGLSKKYEDKLDFALKMAVAGNVIDLGIHRSFDIEEAINQVLHIGFTINDYKDFVQELNNAEEVMILGDNAGEVVFDKILVKELSNLGKKITYVVKEGPILNDSTMEDAKYVGMDKLAHVMTNGSNYLGTCLTKVSSQFVNEFRKAPLIISKGQANFESLEAEDLHHQNVYFLLKLKCEDVAHVAGKDFGDMVFMKKK